MALPTVNIVEIAQVLWQVMMQFGLIKTQFKDKEHEEIFKRLSTLETMQAVSATQHTNLEKMMSIFHSDIGKLHEKVDQIHTTIISHWSSGKA